MEFFDRYFHIPLPIVTKHELGLPFLPRNLPIKFRTNPSTIFLVIRVTDRHTDKPTPVKTYFHTFAGRIKRKKTLPNYFQTLKYMYNIILTQDRQMTRSYWIIITTKYFIYTLVATCSLGHTRSNKIRITTPCWN